MFKISSNGIITVNRGDSFELPISLQTGDAMNPVKYTLQQGDVIYLGIMEPNQPFETAIVRKKFEYTQLDENNNIYIRFWPNDTVCLLPGKYYYQVKIQTYDVKNNKWDVETVIDKTLFYIQE